MMNFGRTPRRIASKPLDRELGFGKTVTTTGRMMNPDGSFNVKRRRIGMMDNVYTHLVSIAWWKFILLVLAGFTLLNCIFATIYCLIGIEHLNGTQPGSFVQNFRQAYFFSSQTLTTVGYGHISPLGLMTNIAASLESFFGLLTFALISGLLYGRFSRPVARIAFSDNMLIAPFKTGQALMFRMINARISELIETEVQLILTINQRDEQGSTSRVFFQLPLQINKISFFSLSWTIVHALDAESPLSGFSQQDLVDSNAEFLVFVKGTDDTNQQIVHTKRSYIAEDVVWNARFRPVLSINKNGIAEVETQLVGEHEVLAES